MTTITLDSVKAEQTRLATMIAALEAAAARTVLIDQAEIKLRADEHYAGLVLGADGKPSHHLILLPGQLEDVSWARAGEWADKLGGCLPTRSEQSLLYANLKAQFEPAWHWSSETDESAPSYAWIQDFDYGSQLNVPKSNVLRARAVRRLKI